MHALFICDLSKFLGDLRDDGNNVVLRMDTNDYVRDGSVTKSLREIGMFEAVVSNHKEKSVPTTPPIPNANLSAVYGPHQG